MEEKAALERQSDLLILENRDLRRERQECEHKLETQRQLFEQYKDFVRTNIDVFDFERVKGSEEPVTVYSSKQSVKSPPAYHALDMIDLQSEHRTDKVDYFMEDRNCGASMYDVPLNELDDEIKAQIYNPTDPDNCSVQEDERDVKPFCMPRASRNKLRAVNQALNTGVTTRSRKTTNTMTLMMTPARKETSRSKSNARKMQSTLQGSNFNSTFTRSTNMPSSTPRAVVMSVLDLSRKPSRQRRL